MKLRVAFLILVSFVSLMRPSESKRRQQCHICHKWLSNAGNLTVHLRSHDPTTKNLKCRFCDKKFRKDQNRQHHERTHTGECPFECDDCGKGFKQRSNLTRHQLRVHQGVKLPCPMCDKKYSDKRYLRRHMKKIHTETESSSVPTFIPYADGDCSDCTVDTTWLSRELATFNISSTSSSSQDEIAPEDLLPEHSLEDILASIPNLSITSGDETD